MHFLSGHLKTTAYFLATWIFLLFLVFARLVSMGLLELTPAAFWDFLNAPWNINHIKSSQYGLPTATLVTGGLFSTFSLALPAILLALPVLYRFWKEGLPPVFISAAKVISSAPFFWWGLVFVGFFHLFNLPPEHNPLIPFFLAFLFYTFAGVNFLRRPRPWPAQVSFVLMATGSHLAFETVVAWPGIGPLLFNSILQQDYLLVAVIFAAIISLVMLINWLWVMGEETNKILRGEGVK